MENLEIINSFLSEDATKVTEAKAALRALLDARASKFRVDSSKFVAKSLFESGMIFVPPGFKVGDTSVHAGEKVVLDSILPDGSLQLKGIEGGTLYKVSSGDAKGMTFEAPGVQPAVSKAGSVGNGLYKAAGDFTPPGGTPPGVKS